MFVPTGWYQPPVSNLVLNPDVKAIVPAVAEWFQRSAGFPSDIDALTYLLFTSQVLPVTDGKQGDVLQLPWVPGGRWGDIPALGPVKHYNVMVVNKMPGVEEAHRKANFIGNSGKFLREVCDELGLNTHDWYVTNVVRFQPPDGGKSLKQEHIKECQWLLRHEIELVRPQFLLLLGADAVKAVCGRAASLTKMRSNYFAFDNATQIGEMPKLLSEADVLSTQMYGIKVMATIHPVAVLKENGFKEGFVRDMHLFGNWLSNRPLEGVDFSKCDYRYCYRAEDIAKSVDEVINGGYTDVALDCEWVGADHRSGFLRSVQFSWKDHTAAVAVMSDSNGYFDAADQMGKIRELERLFNYPKLKLIGHNMRADAKWLEYRGLHVMNKFHFDSMLADHMLNENAEHGLDACAVRYTDMGRYDTKLVQFLEQNKMTQRHLNINGFKGIPDDILLPYGACDADATFRVAQVLKQRLNDEPALKYCFEQIVMPTNFPIHEIEMTGFLIDTDRMIPLTELFNEKKKDLLAAVHRKLGNDALNPRSPQQMRKLLFGPPDEGGFGLEPYKTTGKPSRMWADLKDYEKRRHTPSTDAETLGALADANPVVSMLHDFKVIDQITKSFLQEGDEDEESGRVEYSGGLMADIDDDGRIRTTISQMSETGRWKSSKPNCFHPDVEFLTRRGWVPGYTLEDRDEVAQYDRATGFISFAVPEVVHRQEWNGELIHVFTDKQIDLLMTPDHNCLLKDRENNWKVVKAADYPEDHLQISAGRYVGGQVHLSQAEVTLIAALQADGSVTQWGSYDFSFQKQRKIDRFKAALDAKGISYKQYDRKSGGKRFYIFREDVPDWWRDRKYFGPWLLSFDRETLDLMADEVWFWDGCWGKKSMFASALHTNADWVQILTTLSGRRAKVRQYVSSGGSLSWQVDATYKDHSMTTNRTVERVPYVGRVYCVTMPLGTCVVRYHGRVHVTCQCQNLPKKQDKEISRIVGDDVDTIRSCFIASPGCVLVEADYKSAEIFTLGYLANCDKLLKDAMGDLHARGAVARFGAEKWEGYDQYLPPPAWWLKKYKSLRVCAKTVTFGIPYQRGAAAIARQIMKDTQGTVNCDVDRAKAMIAGFYADYPEIREYVLMCQNAVKDPGWLFNPFHRRRRFIAHDSEAALAAHQREAVNFPIQSTVADNMNVAAQNFYWWRELNPRLAMYKILLAIHDAGMFEVPVEYLDLFTQQVIPQCMRDGAVVPSWVPIQGRKPTKPFSLDVDIAVTLRWGEEATAEELKARGVSDAMIEMYAA